MHKAFLKTAAITGGLAVVLGAFAAHLLKEKLSPDTLQIFETAVRYQFYHVFALLAAGILFKEFTNNWIKWAGYLFMAGFILFSGSLYLLCYVKYSVLPMNWIGAVTPFGGAAFIGGWICLAMGVSRKN